MNQDLFGFEPRLCSGWCLEIKSNTSAVQCLGGAGCSRFDGRLRAHHRTQARCRPGRAGAVYGHPGHAEVSLPAAGLQICASLLPFQQPLCPSYATLPHVFRVRIAPGAYEACSPKRLPSCFVWLRSDFIRDGVAAAQRFQNKLLMPVLYGEVLIKNPAVQQQMMQYAKAHHIQIVGANGADIGNGLAGHPTPYKWV